MANHAATAGLVKIGGTTVGEIRSYNLSETAGTIEDTTLSDTSKTYKVGQTTFSGSCEMFWDEADSGQNAVTIGATVVLTLSQRVILLVTLMLRAVVLLQRWVLQPQLREWLSKALALLGLVQLHGPQSNEFHWLGES